MVVAGAVARLLCGGRLFSPQRRQYAQPCAPVGWREAQSRLLGGNCPPGQRADYAVRLADRMAARQQKFLQLAALGTSDAGVIGGPGGGKGAAAAQTISQMGDGKGIALRRVVGI